MSSVSRPQDGRTRSTAGCRTRRRRCATSSTPRAAAAPLNSLRKLIDAIHAREDDAGASRREGWRALRGSLHQALALRGSRVALYDLRESIPAGGDAAAAVVPGRAARDR